MITNVLLIIIGHILAALIVYFNHRFIFHGKLRRYPIFKSLSRLHALHHANAYSKKVDEFIHTPWWGKVLISLFLISIGLFASWYLSLGFASFAALYAYRHWSIHHNDFTSKFSIHHRLHHEKNVKKNFSGIYPIIDKIFKTSIE